MFQADVSQQRSSAAADSLTSINHYLSLTLRGPDG
jgi:hypothetical protein